MAICLNCGEKLSIFNERFGINPDTEMCPKCRKIFDSFFDDFQSNASLYWLDNNRNFLLSNGVTQSGIHELEVYIEEHEALEKAKKQALFEFASANQYSDLAFNAIAIENLRASGAEGYYEYAVKSLVDENGKTDMRKMVALLNEMGLAGWRLITSHTNELGKNALALAGVGVNSSADETVLIFERYVRI